MVAKTLSVCLLLGSLAPVAYAQTESSAPNTRFLKQTAKETVDEEPANSATEEEKATAEAQNNAEDAEIANSAAEEKAATEAQIKAEEEAVSCKLYSNAVLDMMKNLETKLLSKFQILAKSIEELTTPPPTAVPTPDVHAALEERIVRIAEEIKSVDSDQNGVISEEEFMGATGQSAEVFHQAEELFKNYDSDENGFISSKQLHSQYRDLRLDFSEFLVEFFIFV